MVLTVKAHVLVRLGCLLALFNVGCESLKDLRVSVPAAIRRGETAIFMCDFDLEEDQLYAVKWYKGRKEFYRYTPKDEFPIKTFAIDHVYVDKNKSNMTQLALLRVTPTLSGIYNCEVSAESPSFHTVLASGEMTVVEIPLRDPEILGVKQRYGVSETLEATCQAGPSRPAANITWYINGEKVSGGYIRTLAPENDPKHQTLQLARSRLTFTVKSHTFRSGVFTLKCAASIFHIYHKNVQVQVEDLGTSETKEILVFVESIDDGRPSTGPINKLIHLKDMLFFSLLVIYGTT